MPVGIRFAHLENAILGLLRAEIMGNIRFHIEYSCSELSIGHGPRGTPQLQSRFPVSLQHDTTKLLVMLASYS